MTRTSTTSILYLSLEYPPETGAAATRVHALASRWAETSDVTVIAPVPDSPPGTADRASPGRGRVDEDGVTVVRVWTPSASNDDPMVVRGVKYLWFMVASVVVALRLDPPDAVIGTSPQLFTALAGWGIGALRGAPFVFEVRDLWPESLDVLDGGAPAPVYRALERLARFLYRRAEAVSVVTPGMADQVVAAGADRESVWVHTNGVEPEPRGGRRPSVAPDVISEEDLAGRFVVSYVGSVDHVHSLSVVLDAAELLASDPGYDDVVFVVVGGGTEYATLEAEARSRRLDDVLFPGRFPKRQIHHFLAVSDAALVHLRAAPLLRTALPSKTFEAMAAGVPVVMGVEGDAAALVEEAEAGIPITPERPDELAAAIRRLHDDEAFREACGRRGAAYVREHFTWDALARAYLDDIESLVSRRRQGRADNG